MDSYWENGDFETTLIKADTFLNSNKLIDIGVYKNDRHRDSRVLNIKVDERFKLKKIVPYIPPSTAMLHEDIDAFPTKYPNIASFGYPTDGIDDMGRELYFITKLFIKVKKLPKDIEIIGKDRPVHIYKTLTCTSSYNDTIIFKTWNGITKSGRHLNTLFYQSGAHESHLIPILNSYLNRHNHWNIEATLGQKSLLFGVIEEQVKSLFYARQEPLTDTGRKRPILHWVTAHKRRIKKGIEVDVRKHMRGITEFDMHGIHFKITQPVKNVGGIY